jgi:hypothetical protein
MRVAALNDVHGNLPALEAVLAHPRLHQVDVVESGGDVCAGPMLGTDVELVSTPSDVVELLRAPVTAEEAARLFEERRRGA